MTIIRTFCSTIEYIKQKFINLCVFQHAESENVPQLNINQNLIIV